MVWSLLEIDELLYFPVSSQIESYPNAKKEEEKLKTAAGSMTQLVKV